MGIRSVAVTAGYVSPEPRAEFFAHMDAANVDLKGFTEAFYVRHTRSHLQPVLETLEYIRHETDVWLELTVLLIPGENDSAAEITAMCRWVVERLGADTPIHFTAFHPDFRMLDKPATPPATLAMARRIALAEGLRYAYVGNVHDLGRQSTACHGCGERIIGRDWHVLSDWRLDGRGACRACGTPMAGVLEAQPGVWGARRLPVRLADYEIDRGAEAARIAHAPAQAVTSASPKLSVSKRKASKRSDQ